MKRNREMKKIWKEQLAVEKEIRKREYNKEKMNEDELKEFNELINIYKELRKKYRELYADIPKNKPSKKIKNGDYVIKSPNVIKKEEQLAKEQEELRIKELEKEEEPIADTKPKNVKKSIVKEDKKEKEEEKPPIYSKTEYKKMKKWIQLEKYFIRNEKYRIKTSEYALTFLIDNKENITKKEFDNACSRARRILDNFEENGFLQKTGKGRYAEYYK
jgi:hypothetical protein